MCGIVGAVAERDVTPILIEGLKRLEYRGYDSAGIAVIDHNTCIDRVRRSGKVRALVEALENSPIAGRSGVAHTRWATHGEPSEVNAHPHICNKSVAIVHNGIIENHGILRSSQQSSGFQFTSETDTEVAVHQIEHYLKSGSDLLDAVRKAVADFEGAYALGVVSARDPKRLIASRSGSPLVIGIGDNENYIASDASALVKETRQFIYLEEGDIADISTSDVVIYDREGKRVERQIQLSELDADATGKGEYEHYMLKEIYEQPSCLIDVLEGRVQDGRLLEATFGLNAEAVFKEISVVQIIACGTSYHAGLIAKYWIEDLVGIPCNVEVASEFRYRNPVVLPDTLVITISQSGETADTLAALRSIKDRVKATLAICNAPESSLVRESQFNLMTRAGPEIGVASTKAFTSQLLSLLMLVVALGRTRKMESELSDQLIHNALSIPAHIEKILQDLPRIKDWASDFTDLNHTIFLGRGVLFPIALEGALKLKEISYIHADAYPAGELKHGPIALIEKGTPILAIACKDDYEDKIRSNLQEVITRGGRVYLFADEKLDMSSLGDQCQIYKLPSVISELAPILYAVPLQLFAYFVALGKGTDVDQPRNLAKSVTVE